MHSEWILFTNFTIWCIALLALNTLFYYDFLVLVKKKLLNLKIPEWLDGFFFSPTQSRTNQILKFSWIFNVPFHSIHSILSLRQIHFALCHFIQIHLWYLKNHLTCNSDCVTSTFLFFVFFSPFFSILHSPFFFLLYSLSFDFLFAIFSCSSSSNYQNIYSGIHELDPDSLTDFRSILLQLFFILQKK